MAQWTVKLLSGDRKMEKQINRGACRLPSLFWTLVSLTHISLFPGREQPPHSAPTFCMHREDAKEALKHVFVPRPALCRPLSAVSFLLGMARLTRLGWEGEFGVWEGPCLAHQYALRRERMVGPQRVVCCS